jgi:hypothetical protein
LARGTRPNKRRPARHAVRVLVAATIAAATLLSWFGSGASAQTAQLTYWSDSKSSSGAWMPFDGEVLPVTVTDNGTGPIDVLECSADAANPGGHLLRDHCGTPIEAVSQGNGTLRAYLPFSATLVTTAGTYDCTAAGACKLYADIRVPGSVEASSAVQGTNNSCNGAFQGNPIGTLTKTVRSGGVALANGATVNPGMVIEVTLTWSTGDFAGTTNQASDCVTINGTRAESLETNIKPGPTPTPGTTSWVSTYTVPSGLSNGSQICDRGRVSGTPTGTNATTQKSSTPCFNFSNAPDPIVPEVPWVPTLVVSSMALAGGFTVYSRRRGQISAPRR